MRKKLVPEIITLMLAVLCVLTVVLVHRGVDYDRYASVAATPFFLLEPDDVTEEQITEYAGIRRTYTFTIPDSASATATGARLTVFLRHTLAELYIDDAMRYSNYPGTEGDVPSRVGNTPGSYWISIPIRPEYAGKTARIILTPVYRNVLDEKPEFRIVTRDMLLSMIVLPENGLMIVLSLLAAVSGIFLAIMALALPLERPEKQQIFFLGTVAVTAGIWKLCGLPAVPLMLEFRGIHKEIWFAGTISYMLMLYLSLRMILTIRGETDHLIGKVCLYTGAAAVAALILLQIFGVLELYQALVWYGIGMVILHLLPFAKQKPARAELMWIIPLFLTLGADLLIALHNHALGLSPVFLVWLILYLYVRGFGFVRGAILRKRLLQKKQEELREAKVRTMMNQIRPHFIYNTLTSVYVLCRDDPERAALMVQNFTEYLQSNFTAMTATELISFPDELRHTKAYISMESFRYRDKLTVEYDIRHSAFRLPALTLQPLVENAIKHCLGKGIAPEHIVISSWAEGAVSCITVKDNGPGFDPQEQIGEEHVGLENVRERLQLMCGGTLDIQSSKDSGTLITISIPTSRTGDMLP